ncbi:MAG: PrsW family intramembrane metalloprotease [Proteobacteria bacterium]|nr:PrsW family intramembrane metalloprotease [Pseudomonadota bacterium]
MLVWLSVPAAVLPIVAFLWLVWWLDRYDREPLGLFAVAFGWGAIGGILLTLLGSDAFAQPVAETLGITDPHLVHMVILAPILEEPAKALVLLLLVRARQFDNTTDGFVYGAATGLGFGMTENLMYFRAAADTGDAVAFAALVAARTLYSALMHASASSCIGAALGYSKFRNGAGKWGALAGGLIAALGIHALWNGLLYAGFQGQTTLGKLDFILFPIEFAVLFAIFNLSLLDEKRIIQRELQEEVDLGVLPPPHLAYLGAYRRRIRPGWLPAGMDGALYIRRATTLAFRKHQLKVNAEPGHYADEITRLRREIVQQLQGAGLAPEWIPALEEATDAAREASGV